MIELMIYTFHMDLCCGKIRDCTYITSSAEGGGLLSKYDNIDDIFLGGSSTKSMTIWQLGGNYGQF